jgi:predicted metal-binding protein
MKQYTSFLKKAKGLGAKDAKIISARNIFTAEWVRLKCQFGCERYGRCLTCPPYSPTPEQTRRMLAHYKHALLIHGDENSASIKRLVVDLEKEIFMGGYYKAFGIGAGPCYFCAKCNLKLCHHADKARPSLEACGIDVFRTARANGFPIEVLKSESCEADYYGLVLIE